MPPKAKQKRVKYDPKKHLRPLTDHEKCSTYDEVEASVQQFIAEEIGQKRFDELEEEDYDALKEATVEITESIASLFKTPQEQYEYYPYTLGNDDTNPKNGFFYDPKNTDKPLGKIND
jgi:hypothetical protein